MQITDQAPTGFSSNLTRIVFHRKDVKTPAQFSNEIWLPQTSPKLRENAHEVDLPFLSNCFASPACSFFVCRLVSQLLWSSSFVCF
ncbi:MAG: hypothetical protein ACI814_003548 [Mariniblastus sp.]|jgi:hypothetical protein